MLQWFAFTVWGWASNSQFYILKSYDKTNLTTVVVTKSFKILNAPSIAYLFAVYPKSLYACTGPRE